MVINTNLGAMNANRSAKKVGSDQMKASARLSSGLRINSASDDAAGLAISEKMRAQIRGLDQASRNSLDGISLIQTAEGGMSAMSDMLNRIRELTVQAANDTNMDSDRGIIQEEINQLLLEIEDTPDKVEFNKLKVLSGAYGEGMALTPTQMEMLEFLYGTWINDSLRAIQQQTGLTFDGNVTLDVKFGSMSPGVLASMGSIGSMNQFYLTISADYTKSITEACSANGNSGPYIGGIFMDRVIAHEMMHAVMRDNVNSGVSVPQWFTEGLAEAINGASDSRFGNFGNASTQSQAQGLMAGDFNNSPYNAGYLAVMYMDGRGGPGKIEQLLNNLKTASSFDAAVAATYGGLTLNDLVTEMKNVAASNFDTFLSTAGIGKDGKSYALKGLMSDATNIIPNAGSGTAISDPNNLTMPDGQIMTINWALQSEGTPLHLQIGANSNQSMYISIGDMSINRLGITNIDVSDHFNATAAIQQVDNAREIVSSERARLGAYQNRLEYTIKSLDVSGENITSAESRIRDTDMAKEMMNLTKLNVLNQAATSMLATANQSPQTILQLLK